MSIDLRHPSDQADFLSNLSEEKRLMCEFVRLLEEEQQALLGQDGELILAFAGKKSQQVIPLNSLAEKRRQALLSVQTEPNTELWLQQNAPQYLPEWEEIRQLAASSQQINQTNGKLIHIKLRNTQQTLSALYSAAQNTTADLYGRDGQQNLVGSGRTLGSV